MKEPRRRSGRGGVPASSAAARASGTATSTTRPVRSQRRSTVPPSWPRTVASITREPKPRRDGGASDRRPARFRPAQPQHDRPRPSGGPRASAPRPRRRGRKARRAWRRWWPTRAAPWRRAAPPPGRAGPAARPATRLRATPPGAVARCRVGRQLPFGDGAQVGAGPAAFGEQRVHPPQRGHPRLDGGGEGPRLVARGQADHRLHHRQRVLGPVVDLAREQLPPRLVGLAGRDVAHDAGEEAPALAVAPLGDGKVERHHASRPCGGPPPPARCR